MFNGLSQTVELPDGIDVDVNLANWVRSIFDGGKKERILGVISSRLANCCKNPRECAEEVLHEILIDLQHIDIRNVENPEAYLIRSAARLGVRAHRKRAVENRSWLDDDVVELLHYLFNGAGPQVEQQRAAAKLIVKEFKNASSEEEWIIFDLHYYQGFTDKEISRLSETYFNKKLTRGAIRQRVRRVADKFREFSRSSLSPDKLTAGDISHRLIVHA